MKTFLLSLILFVGFTAQATYIPQQETITIAGRTLPAKGLITLNAVVGGASSRCVAREPNASSGYTPSGALDFHVKAMRVLCTTSGTFMYLVSNDTDIGFNTGAAWTGVTYISGDVEASKVMNGCTPGAYVDIATDFVILNGRFAGIENHAATGEFRVQLYGYEE